MLTDLAKLYAGALVILFAAQVVGACLALVFDRMIDWRRGRNA